MDKEKVIDGVRDFLGDIRNGLNDQYDQNLDESFYQGYDVCMRKTMDLLVDANLKDDMIIALLQKHFDLRLTEAQDMIRTAKNRKARRLNKKK